MINFRFHLVSLIAVFLALALGVVMGSTVIDRAVVNGLENRIKHVENKAEARKRENTELRAQVDQLQGAVDGSAPFAVTGRLESVRVAVVAVRGVDGDALKGPQGAVTLAQQAGAQAPGVLWLEQKLALPDDATTKQLADILGKQESAKALREDAWKALAERLGQAGQGGDTGLRGPDLLAALNDAGFVQFESVGGQAGGDFSLAAYPGDGARVLLVDGTDGKLSASELVGPLARALATVRMPIVAAEVYRDRRHGPDRGEAVKVIRDDGELKQTVSTVDDLDLVEGRIAAVLALADLGRRVVGHYGYGDGAKSLPAWSSP
jgi:hypothetical protein